MNAFTGQFELPVPKALSR